MVDSTRPVTRGGCKGAGAPPFLLKEGCNDEFAPPLVPYKEIVFIVINYIARVRIDFQTKL